MRTTLTLILPVLLFCGCSTPSLVNQMKQRGISHQNTGKIVLIGSEADVGSTVKVEIEEQFLIQEIWDSIYQSRPYDLWYASGYRRADFYSSPNQDPVVTLWINASDGVCIDRESKMRFRCPKLDTIVMKHLQDKYEKDKKANQPQRVPPDRGSH